MSDLISREDLFEKFKEKYCHKYECSLIGDAYLCEECKAYEAYKLIVTAPAVDAEPVVRCKDCAFYIPWGEDGKICGRVGGYYGKTKPDDFCSRSIRMDLEV